MNDIDVLIRDLKKYGNAGRDCALSAEDALIIAAALEAAREDAERLAETLQKLAAHIRPTCSVLWDEAQAALRDHDQEGGDD